MASDPRPKKKSVPKARRWVFTSYDVGVVYLRLRTIFEPPCKFCVAQVEISPTTGNKHVQGYLEFSRQLRRTGVQKYIGDLRCHVEVAKGNSQQNENYCSKDESRDPEFVRIRHGSPARSRQGNRTDLKKIHADIQKGVNIATIANENPVAWIKYSKGIKSLHALHHSQKRGLYVPHLELHVLYGDPGAGKTRFVYDRHGHENVYSPIWNGKKYWFSEYSGQKVLLLNEFYGQCRASYLQDLIDKYRVSVETKGGSVTSNWDYIYMTSNCHPRDWYNGWENLPRLVEKSIIRRMNSITHLEAPNVEELEWDNVPSLPLSIDQLNLDESEEKEVVVPQNEASITHHFRDTPHLVDPTHPNWSIFASK